MDPNPTLAISTKDPFALGNASLSSEYYGVVVYMLSVTSWIVFVAWAFLPDSILHALGITYYPDRWWALAIPAWSIATIIFIVIYTQLHILIHTPSPDSLESFTDSFAKVKVDTYELYDIPVSQVSTNLYRRS